MGASLVEYESGHRDESRRLVGEILAKPGPFVTGGAYQQGLTARHGNCL